MNQIVLTDEIVTGYQEHVYIHLLRYQIQIDGLLVVIFQLTYIILRDN